MHNKSVIKGLMAVALVAIIGVVVALIPKKQEVAIDTVKTPTPEPVSTPTPKVIPAPKPASPYKDGVYSAVGTYNSPGGIDNLGVSVTLKGGVIVDSAVTNQAGDNTSVRYQNMFISGYKQFVTGKNIDEVTIGKVSGSSLTGTGFNAALTKIKIQAKA